MASKRLNTHVHIPHPETGAAVDFGPGDDLPEWAVDAITNPDVWDTGEDEADDGPVPGPSQRRESRSGFTPEGDDDPLAGLSKTALLAAAEAWDADGVSDKSNRAQIAAALRAAGYEGDGSDLDQ
jgi:hypothetical protein